MLWDLKTALDVGPVITCDHRWHLKTVVFQCHWAALIKDGTVRLQEPSCRHGKTAPVHLSNHLAWLECLGAYSHSLNAMPQKSVLTTQRGSDTSLEQSGCELEWVSGEAVPSEIKKCHMGPHKYSINATHMPAAALTLITLHTDTLSNWNLVTIKMTAPEKKYVCYAKKLI